MPCPFPGADRLYELIVLEPLQAPSLLHILDGLRANTRLRPALDTPFVEGMDEQDVLSTLSKLTRTRPGRRTEQPPTRDSVRLFAASGVDLHAQLAVEDECSDDSALEHDRQP